MSDAALVSRNEVETFVFLGLGAVGAWLIVSTVYWVIISFYSLHDAALLSQDSPALSWFSEHAYKIAAVYFILAGVLCNKRRRFVSFVSALVFIGLLHDVLYNEGAFISGFAYAIYFFIGGSLAGLVVRLLVRYWRTHLMKKSVPHA